MTTPTRDKPSTAIADSSTWPTHANGDRIKPLGILLSAAGRDKHCGKEATAAQCLSVQLRHELELARQVVERIAAVEGHPRMNAGTLAAIELAISLVASLEPETPSEGQLAWDRNEGRR